MNEVDAGRDRATPASVRHDDDEPLTPISSDVWSLKKKLHTSLLLSLRATPLCASLPLKEASWRRDALTPRLHQNRGYARKDTRWLTSKAKNICIKHPSSTGAKYLHPNAFFFVVSFLTCLRIQASTHTCVLHTRACVCVWRGGGRAGLLVCVFVV
jgi:hypothetical protein